MPWKASGNSIIRADTGKVVGHSSSHAKASASVRARYANTKTTDKLANKSTFAHKGAAMVKSAKKGKK